MGSIVTRQLRDLGDIGGFEALSWSDTGLPGPETETEVSAESCPATPTAIEPVRVLELDPRSPTAEIVRTPIEVSSKFHHRVSQDSPMSNVLHSRRSYLETDLDTLSTSESISKPDSATKELNSSLPPGLTCAHLLKLQFLGIDPRSPSSGVARTPIQIGKNQERGASPLYPDDTVSLGSVSSYDIFNNSLCSSDFTRDCSDPSAFISENEDVSDKEEEECVSEPNQESTVETNDLLKEDCVEALPKASNKLMVFQENEANIGEADDKGPVATPEGNKKSAVNRVRTPLTPIGNHRTPNSILRAKQSQTIEKEILTKVKIYSTDENAMSPSRVLSVGSSKKENVSGSGRSGRKGLTSNNGNVLMTSAKKRILGQWDQDNSVII